MRILHLSDALYPLVTGGTEIFIQQLIEAQKSLKPDRQVLWAAHDENGCWVNSPKLSELGTGQCLLPVIKSGTRLEQSSFEAAETPGFDELLATYRPTTVHMHSFSEMCGLKHARASKIAGAKLVVTVHAPGFSCIKGNLINSEGEICDGILREDKCTQCRLNNGGLPRWLAGIVAMQNGWPLNVETSGKMAHVLTARQLTAKAHSAWRELAEQADAIHVLAEWSRDVLIRQGIAAHKIHLIRTAGPATLPKRERKPMQDGVLRLVYWGRCVSVKGLHLVIEAIKEMNISSPIQLDCYGPYWDSDYGQSLMARIGDDRRVRVLGNMPKDKLLGLLQSYDLAVVPSTWLETGPLTVLEAFAAGLPVAGSDLGGIREQLLGIAGCQLLPLDANAWKRYLLELMENPASIAYEPPRPNRSFIDLAHDMEPLYAND